MTFKITTEWIKPTREMFKLIDGGRYEYFCISNDTSYPKRVRAFDFKVKYAGKTYSNKHQRIHFKDNVVTIDVPLSKKESDEYWNYSYQNSHRACITKFGENYHSKNDIVISMDEFLAGTELQLKGIDKYNAFIDLLRVGDFVKFSTQRDKDSWRKIMKLDIENNFIFGWKYTQPIDDEQYDTRNSSDNMISAIIDYRENENNPR